MVYEKENFLSFDLCDKLIEKAKDIDLHEASTLGHQIDGYRVAFTLSIDDSDESSLAIKDIVSKEIGVSTLNMERISIIKYNVGGEYKEHQDFFHPGEGYYDEQVSQGGQRIKTALIYLNDGYEGGQTAFPILGVTIQPKKGKAVFWDNSQDGMLNYETLHAGLPVISGVKYIATIWVRENEYTKFKN